MPMHLHLALLGNWLPHFVVLLSVPTFFLLSPFPTSLFVHLVMSTAIPVLRMTHFLCENHHEANDDMK